MRYHCEGCRQEIGQEELLACVRVNEGGGLERFFHADCWLLRERQWSGPPVNEPRS